MTENYRIDLCFYLDHELMCKVFREVKKESPFSPRLQSHWRLAAGIWHLQSALIFITQKPFCFPSLARRYNYSQWWSETPLLRFISAVREVKWSLKCVSNARSLGVDNPDMNKVLLIININEIPANAAQKYHHYQQCCERETDNVTPVVSGSPAVSCKKKTSQTLCKLISMEINISSNIPIK